METPGLEAEPVGGGAARHGQDNPTDEYGFSLKLDESSALARQRSLSRGARRDARWAKLSSAGGGRLRPKPGGALKRAIRKGVPPLLRPEVWMQTSAALGRKAAAPPHYYNSLHEALPEKHVVDQIDADINRTFAGNERFDTPAGHALLRRVLLAYARHNPAIGYCQSMNYLTAFLQIVVPEEENVFWLLVTLMEDCLYEGTHSHDLSGTLVEFKVLNRLLQDKLPKLAAHLESTGTDLTFICSKWLLCVYCDILPSETAARVWDCVFSEGSKIFFRVALALLHQQAPALLQTNDMGNIMRILQGACQQAHDADLLLDYAFNRIGSLPMKKVDRYRAKAAVVVAQDQRQRQARLSAAKEAGPRAGR